MVLLLFLSSLESRYASLPIINTSLLRYPSQRRLLPLESIVIHGGCEGKEVSPAEQLERTQGVEQAGIIGWEHLAAGAAAEDAVQAALEYLEDHPAFDAGLGSYPNLVGDYEMDALMMNSRGEAGGVACIQDVQHPIAVARKVKEHTPHHLLVGLGAQWFARLHGLPPFRVGPKTQRQPTDQEAAELLDRYLEIIENQTRYSTVGAIARDTTGHICAGTSTGGIPGKLPGRMGDSAIIGAGTYASQAGAACATGVGEGIMRLAVTRQVVQALAQGLILDDAIQNILAQCSHEGIPCGIIAMTAQGHTLAAHNGTFMPVWQAAQRR